MTLIERYITAVTNHLPQDIRTEVGLELRSNILDTLPDDPTDAQIIAVLEGLGSPSQLAMEYVPEKHYLIGPTLYPKYVATLKLVLTFVAIALTVVSAITVVFSEQSITSVGFFTKLMSRALTMVAEGLLQTFVITTVVFAILERNKVLDGSNLFSKKKWRIEDLEEPAPEKSIISKGEATVGICFNLIFATLFLAKPNLIPIAIMRREGLESIPLFNFDVLKSYVPFVAGLFILSAAFGVYKLFIGRWNRQMAMINTVLSFSGITLFMLMAFNTALISEGAKLFVSSHLSKQWFVNSIWIGAAIFIGLTLWDVYAGWRKASH